MKLRSIVIVSLVGALVSAPVMHAANDAAQAAQPSRLRSLWNGVRSAFNGARSAVLDHYDINYDDVVPAAQDLPAAQDAPVAQDVPANNDEQARPFSAQAREFVNERVDRVRAFIDNNRQRAGAAINAQVNRAGAAARNRIRQELLGVVQEEINDIQNNPQRQEEILNGARNMAANFAQSPAGQQLRDEAVNAARAQIPNVVNGIKEEMKKPENAQAFEEMADQFMNGNHQASIFERIKNSFMESTRATRWGLTSLGVLGSICFAYKIGTWLKEKFWGAPMVNDENEAADNPPHDSRAALRDRVSNAQPEIVGGPLQNFLMPNDQAKVTQAIACHQAYLKNQKMNAKVRALAQGQLEVLQRASNNQNALANLKVDLGNLDMAFAN